MGEWGLEFDVKVGRVAGDGAVGGVVGVGEWKWGLCGRGHVFCAVGRRVGERRVDETSMRLL